MAVPSAHHASTATNHPTYATSSQIATNMTANAIAPPALVARIVSSLYVDLWQMERKGLQDQMTKKPVTVRMAGGESIAMFAKRIRLAMQ